uniref:hypothetical protein n=1 Tax=Gemmiger formicilis TaxID=745368 RepID=UPI0029434C69
MKNRKLIFIGLFIFLSVVIGSFIYFPKSIDTALNRIKYPFEVGEILTSQQIDENLIVVIYTNKNNNNELQNAIIQKNSIFYSVVEMNGSLNIEIPQKLDSGDLRTQVLVSWYDKSDKYVVMAVAYDEDVAAITYQNQELTPLDINGYHLFYGTGTAPCWMMCVDALNRLLRIYHYPQQY